MEYLAGDELLRGLPLILAGPILRRTEATEVTVWIALKHSCQVDLRVFDTQNSGEHLGQCLFQGSRETVALGQHLHIVAVTARSLTDTVLKCDRIYAYDLHFTADNSSYTLSEGLSEGLSNPGLHGRRNSAESISYFAHQKPTFILPPKDLDHLKIIHGSCRKPHGRGFDALPILDCLLESDADDALSRPHQLFLTGDQIYGDDVADPLLWLATPLGDTLLGWEEKLPLNCDAPAFSPNGQEWVWPKQLPAGQRAKFTTQQAGLTAGLKNKAERTTSHLLSFGEYCGAYLLATSPACWPDHLPTGNQVTTGRKTIRRWNQDKRNMEQFLHTLWKVRRLLANIPTYTIFDDHDVSDDWNLNQAWCLRTLGKPLGRRMVQNAMLAYAAFSAWGNTPEQFEPKAPGGALLAAAQRWSHSGGEDLTAIDAIATYLGLPPTNPHTGLPQFTEDQSVWIFQRDKNALTWHYTIRSACHEVIVLDTRTWRGYPIEGRPIDPPMLLCPSAFHQQVSGPLSEGSSGPDASYGTFIVAPTNVFGMRALDWIQQWHLDQRKVFAADVGDSWNFHDEALATLLTTLFQQRQNIVVLSGDIHYSSVIHVDYQNVNSGDRATLVQLTSSAMKNEELLTQILHTRLKDWLLPERSRQWVGWSSPPDMQELPKEKSRLSKQFTKQSTEHPATAADWRCQMKWLRRQPAQVVDITANLLELIPPRSKPRIPLIKWLKFWQARWFQEGHEVVGVNNIALVYFQPTDESTPAASSILNNSSAKIPPKSLAVKQEHYWFSPWSPTQVVRSRFE